MHEAKAILLAAGLSRRMGTANKLLMPVNGRPMVRHVVEQYCAILGSGVWVVLGHQSSEIAAALQGTAVNMVYNPAFDQGQSTSVATGLRVVPDGGDLLIGLCDQPILDKSDLSDLLSAHRDADPHKISIPVSGDRRGNPIVVPQALRSRLLDDPRAPGCRKFTRAYPDLVQHLTLHAPGYYEDVDTPEVYAVHFGTLTEELT